MGGSHIAGQPSGCLTHFRQRPADFILDNDFRFNS
uniref:RaCI2 inhibitor n=1 Tax=Siphoviridae sp. ctoRD1 TaxID=2825669 RepID=A0A8S5QEX8_9CAUD|nr:MAG TPA: RaCI2 inhibitor [Siphoviridae sp. ctoRD1]